MRKLIYIALITGFTAWLGAAQPESLVIGPGDFIHVHVIDTPEMEQVARVTDAGSVPLAFIGDVVVSGETPAAAAKLIGSALINKGVMLHPEVSVWVDQYATQNVSVMGQVVNPGSYPLITPRPILKILSLAGGMTDIADRHITVEHSSNGKATSATYFLSNESQEAIDSEVLVYPGDTVIVPKAGIVYVLGDVARPGGFPIGTNDAKITALQVIALAGALNRTSKGNQTILIRKTGSGTEQQIPLKVADMEHGKTSDMVLQPNDVIYVPFSWMKNMGMNAAAIAASTSSAAIYAAH